MDSVIKKVGGTRWVIEKLQFFATQMMRYCSRNLKRISRHSYNTIGNEYNMIISTEKTICMRIGKEPIRCKIAMDGKVIQQELKFRYLGIDIISYGDVEEEVRQQVAKASKIAGCLDNTIWKNKHLIQETKSRNYKATVRPFMRYTSEARSDTAKTKRLLETTEMRLLQNIAGKTLLDRERSENIKEKCKTENVNEWILKQKQKWNSHINRLTNERLVRIARDKSPAGTRSVGRSRKDGPTIY